MDSSEFFETDVESNDRQNVPGDSEENNLCSADPSVNMSAFDFSHENIKKDSNELPEIIKKSDESETFDYKVFSVPANTKTFCDRDSFISRPDLSNKDEFDSKSEETQSLNEDKFMIAERNLESEEHIKNPYVNEDNSSLNPVTKKVVNLPDGYTDSSHSSSSELQSSAIPFESSSSSVEHNCRTGRINFENALQPNPVWREPDDNSATNISLLSKPFSDELSSQLNLPKSSYINTTIIDDSIKANVVDTASGTLPVISASSDAPACADLSISSAISATAEKEVKPEIESKSEESKNEVAAPVPAPEPPPLPVMPPAPRKRGRPRKQVLPNPNPLGEPFGPNTPATPAANKSQELTRSTRSERRTRKKKFDDLENGKASAGDSTPKRRYTPKPKTEPRKKRKKPAYVPKKRGPKPGKKHAEVENIQNFEEETRMSASEGQGGFSARSGTLGDESQSSFITEGHTKSNINKKGRMEVMTDGCKPVTVQQIVEYYWPPPSSLPHGEKPEGLMIQEQITEYLGVKSFKRKYPSIKRRPVEMEERNYLQENGFVSENMCDLGLTAVYSADIIEIMYNDFPHKFEEYRKYSREKKAKEQRALREKQAAERADMDPLKEAIESAQLWNAEFNKTRSLNMSTPQRTYNSKVLLGNWYNQNCYDEHKLAMYVKKKERKDLLVVGVRNLFENFLRHVPLSLSLKGLTYGGPFQLLSPDIRAAPLNASERVKNGVVLSVTIDANDVEKVQCIVDDLPVVGSPLRHSCSRNAFLIESDEGKPEGEPLCYGDTIYLRLAEKTEIPLYVEIVVASLGPEAGTCGFPTAKLRLGKTGDARFKILHIRPELRALTDGTPCGPFEKLVIHHAPDNAPLCVETDTWKMSLFSYECEISARTKSVFRNKVDPSNVWMFLVGSV